MQKANLDAAGAACRAVALLEHSQRLAPHLLNLAEGLHDEGTSLRLRLVSSL